MVLRIFENLIRKRMKIYALLIRKFHLRTQLAICYLTRAGAHYVNLQSTLIQNKREGNVISLGKKMKQMIKQIQKRKRLFILNYSQRDRKKQSNIINKVLGVIVS